MLDIDFKQSRDFYNGLNEQRKALIEKEANKINESSEEREKFIKNYRKIMNEAAKNSNFKTVFREGARNEAFGTVLKAIYITALEAETLFDENLILAENLVDNWIKDNGGAYKILNPLKEKTYLLNRIYEIVEESADEETKEIEKDPEELLDAAKKYIKNASPEKREEFMDELKDTEKKEKEEDEEKKEDSKEDEKESEDKEEKKADDEESKDKEDKEEKPEEEKEESGDGGDSEEDSGDDNDSEKKDDVDDPLSSDFDDDEDDLDKEEDGEFQDDKEDTDDEDKKAEDEAPEEKKGEESEGEDLSDDQEEDLGEPLDDDQIDSDMTVDGDTENKGKIFDDLDKEEDVKKAVELIRKRIADAEETFIKNNAEDKKKVDELLDKISNNVKTVEDLGDDKKDINEAIILNARTAHYRNEIREIRQNRPHTLFEMVCRAVEEKAIKDESIRESFIDEDGNLETDMIVQSAKVYYGFLETLNTLQLVKVDDKFIEEAFNNI